MDHGPLPVSGTAVSDAERKWGLLVHLGVLVLALMTSWAAGLAGAVGAGIILLIRPLGSDFIAHHAREALNFNVSMFIYLVIGVVFSIFTLGLGLIITVPLGIILALVWLICSIMAAMAANDGALYRYPFTLRLF